MTVPSCTRGTATCDSCKEEPRTFRDVVAQLAQARFATKGATGKWSNAELIHGVAAHDLYPAGQIQLPKQLQRR